MTRSIYLIGGPGTGKSTLMARMLEGWHVGASERLTEKELFGHPISEYGGRFGVYLGVLREQFPGTDGLSLSVNRAAVPWAAGLTGREYDLILAEGGRLANRPFLDALSSTTSLLLINLTADFDVARARTLNRHDSNEWKPIYRKGKKFNRSGRPQSDHWLKSRAGASAKLANEYPSVTVDTTNRTPEEVEYMLCAIL